MGNCNLNLSGMTAKELLNKYGAIKTYEFVLNGDLKRFPKFFWNEVKVRGELTDITKHLIESILGWDLDTCKEKLCLNIFIKYKLNGMLRQVYNDVWFNAFDDAYPDTVKPWEFTRAPKHFWNRSKVIEAFKWILENVLKLTTDEEILNGSTRLLKDAGYGSLLNSYFNDSYIDAVLDAYPNRFSVDDFTNKPQGYWTDELVIKTMKDFHAKLGWGTEDIKNNKSYAFYIDSGYGYLIAKYKTLDNLLKLVYPELYS